MHDRSHLRPWILPLTLSTMLGCTVGTSPATDGAVRADAGAPDTGPTLVGDAGRPRDRDTGTQGTDAGRIEPPDPCADASCGETERCGSGGEGDGNDDDCDGSVDEGCPCTAIGVTRGCFGADPASRGIGRCSDGVMRCNEFGRWSTCRDATLPIAEVCNGADDDCDGLTDEDADGCTPSLACPDAESAQPLREHSLSGSAIVEGDATAYRWTLTCPETVSDCPSPSDAASRDTSVYFTTSGTYTATLEVERGDRTEECSWPIEVRAQGLRVELTWDTQGEGAGNTDVDLHLHRRTGRATETDWFTADDCYFENCTASTYDDGVAAAWALDETAESSGCDDAPHGHGARWSRIGGCYNPRLDVDVVRCDPAIEDRSFASFCAPENVNVDAPPDGEPYRIAVNYYFSRGYEGPTNPRVVVYCDGEPRGLLEPPQPLTQGGGFGPFNETWLVADVRFRDVGCGIRECDIVPLEHVQTDARFGPPWSF